MTSVMNTVTILGSGAPAGAAWEVEHVDLELNETHRFRVRGVDAADVVTRARGGIGIAALVRYPPTTRSAPLEAPRGCGGCAGCGGALDAARCLDCFTPRA